MSVLKVPSLIGCAHLGQNGALLYGVGEAEVVVDVAHLARRHVVLEDAFQAVQMEVAAVAAEDVAVLDDRDGGVFAAQGR